MTLFNFYGIVISVIGNPETLKRIEKDFSIFLEPKFKPAEFKIIINKTTELSNIIPNDVSRVYKHPEFVMYAKKTIKYVDYNSEIFSIYSRSFNKLELFSESEDRLHEITYLAILSFAGKTMEKFGKHRVHALGFTRGKNALMLLGETGVGKTTLFLDLLGDQEVSVFSDDICVIDNSLIMYSFPIRIGIREIDREKFANFSSEYIYSINRRKYGSKLLLDSKSLSERISASSKCTHIVKLKRIEQGGPILKQISGFSLCLPLMKNFVIGIGLPQLIEYLDYELSLKSIFRILNIIYKRSVLVLRMLWHCKKYCLCLSNNGIKNVEELMKMLENKND